MPRGRRVVELGDGAWLRQRYAVDGLTADEIAAELGCSEPGVRAALLRHGIPRRVPGRRARVAVGDRFGSWEVLAVASHEVGHARRYLCRCDCGVEKAVDGGQMWRGTSRSCGCQRVPPPSTAVHGHSSESGGSPTYSSWRAMRRRCTWPGHHRWADYGGRGIGVCDRWLNSFENFLEDMGERPPGTTLDRIDTDGHYEPANCRWADAKTQANNKRRKVAA